MERKIRSYAIAFLLLFSSCDPVFAGQKVTGDLEVTGSAKISGGSPAAGKVLTASNDQGLSSWEAVPTPDLSAYLTSATAAETYQPIGSYLIASDLTPYAKLNGTNHPFTYVKTPKIYPAADSTTAIQILKADGTTAVINVDTTNSRVGIGATTPLSLFQVGATGASDVANVVSRQSIVGSTVQSTTSETFLRLERTVSGSLYYPATVDFKLNAYQAGGAGVNYNPSTQLIVSLKNQQNYNLAADIDVLFLTATKRVGIGVTPTQTLDVDGVTLLRDKLAFTQTDLNEYIDSLADGYMDYGATTEHRFKIGATQPVGIKSGRAWFDSYCWFGGTDSAIGYDSNWKLTFAGASSSYGYIARFRSVGTNDNAVFSVSTANNSNGMQIGVGKEASQKYAKIDAQVSGGEVGHVRFYSNGTYTYAVGKGFFGNHASDDSSGAKTQIHGDETPIYENYTAGDPTDNSSYVDSSSGSYSYRSIEYYVYQYKVHTVGEDSITVWSANPMYFYADGNSYEYFQVQLQWNLNDEYDGAVVYNATDGYWIDVGGSSSTTDDGSYSGWNSGSPTIDYSSPYQVQTGSEYTKSANFKGAVILSGQPESSEEPVAGMVYFNSDDSHFYGYNGSDWVQLDNA